MIGNIFWSLRIINMEILYEIDGPLLKQQIGPYIIILLF